MTLSDKIKPGAYPVLFVAEQSHRAFVYYPTRYTNPGKVDLPYRRGLAYSPDGKVFYQGVTHGGSSTSLWDHHSHSFEFSVPQISEGWRARVEYDSSDDLVRIGGELYHRHGKFEGQTVPLPQTRRKVYFLKGDGIDIFVDDWDYSEGYENHRLFFNMDELTITDFVRYRDGGTTLIHTDRGVLFVPTAFNRGLNGGPTWTDKNDVSHKLQLIE